MAFKVKLKHMALNMDKVLVAFNNKSFGEWERSVHEQQVLHFISPMSVFISVTVPSKDYEKLNLLNMTKLITATLVFEKVLANTQQIIEIGAEKKKGFKSEINIFLAHE